MAIAVTLELADYANDSAGANPGFRDTHIMDPDGKQSDPTEGNQDTVAGVPLTLINMASNLSSTSAIYT